MSSPQAASHTAWTPAHFIGGHPALDLCNAVFDRLVPAADNELLKSSRDIGNWLHAGGLADHAASDAVIGIPDKALVPRVHALREATYAMAAALAAGHGPASTTLATLFQHAATGLATLPITLNDTLPRLTPSQWREPDAIIALLAMQALDAFFTLPRERVRACPRCGWLFVDASRGGKRRWCSMQTCGNREKVSRHRDHA